MNSTPEGWYPDAVPGQERWWTGTEWGTEVRAIAGDHPAAPVPPPAGPAPGPSPGSPGVTTGPTNEKKSGCLGIGMGVMFGIIGAFVLLIGGCAALVASSSDEVRNAIEADPSTSAADGGSAATGGTGDADRGTRENPLPFGEAHARRPGLLGAGWSVSIDEVREIPRDPFFTEDGDSRICLAVLVSVTLDSLTGDELVANPFSLPDVNLVSADGQKAVDGFLECDGSSLQAEGFSAKFSLELIEGGSGRYYDPVLVDSADYDFVAVESTVYADPER